MFSRNVGSITIEIDDYIVRIKNGEEVIDEIKCETYEQVRLTAARIENDLSKVFAAVKI
jgi:hypothetical protein